MLPSGQEVYVGSGQELSLHTYSNFSIRTGYTDVAQNLLLYVNLMSGLMYHFLSLLWTYLCD